MSVKKLNNKYLLYLYLLFHILHSANVIFLCCCWLFLIVFIISNIYKSCSYSCFNKFSKFIFHLSIFLLKLISSNSLLWLNTSCIFLNCSNNNNICSQFTIYLLEKFTNKFWVHHVKTLSFWSCLLSWYMILKSKHDKYSAHHVCQCVNCFVIMKYCRFLWSVKTCIKNVLWCMHDAMKVS